MHDPRFSTRLALALVLSGAFAGAAWPQQSGSSVTDQELAAYKRNAQAGCQEGGKKQGDPQEKIDAFCSCLMATLEKSVSDVEWRQLARYSLDGRGEDEKKALDPHLKNLAACRPQQPQSQAQPQRKAEPQTGLKAKPQTGFKVQP